MAPTTRAAYEPPEKPDAADLRAFVTRSVAVANQEAAVLEKSPIVEVAEYARAVYFVPKPAGGVPRGSVTSSRPGSALTRQWTDRYALAQRFSVRFALQNIGTILPPPKDPSLGPTAIVTVKVTGKSAFAVAKDEKPIPACPQGMELWQDVEPGVISGYGGWERKLARLTPPEGAVDAAKANDPLATAALKMLASQAPSSIDGTCRLKVEYIPKAAKWVYRIDDERRRMPRPEKLDWKRFSRQRGVYDPNQFKH
ncbi:MAG: hypothetical protein ACE15C_16650 [Phycisphaerae bacterium]